MKRMGKILGFLSLVILAYGSHKLTSHALGQQKEARRQLRRTANYAVELPQGNKITCPPGKLTIHAKADLINLTFDKDLIWFVQVKAFKRQADGSVKREVVWEEDYDHQPFGLHRGKRQTPSFNQDVQLPAGEYMVTVGLKQLLDSGEYSPLVSRPFRAVVP